MNKTKKILILNTGGTFNKYYDQISGQLKVRNDNHTLETILKDSKISHIKIDGMIYKDSLDMNKKDRIKLVKYILSLPYTKIIIVHGTDTIDITAKYLAKYIKHKTIILTGAMLPFSIDTTEATSNLMLGIGFLQATKNKGIFISMHGLVKSYKKIKKDKKNGVFICQ